MLSSRRVEIAVVNTKMASIQRFGEDRKLERRIFLIYDGTHFGSLSSYLSNVNFRLFSRRMILICLRGDVLSHCRSIGARVPRRRLGFRGGRARRRRHEAVTVRVRCDGRQGAGAGGGARVGGQVGARVQLARLRRAGTRAPALRRVRHARVLAGSGDAARGELQPQRLPRDRR